MNNNFIHNISVKQQPAPIPKKAKPVKSSSRKKLIKQNPSKEKLNKKPKPKRKMSSRLPTKIMTSDSSSINLVTQTFRSSATESDFPVIKVPSSKD